MCSGGVVENPSDAQDMLEVTGETCSLIGHEG